MPLEAVRDHPSVISAGRLRAVVTGPRPVQRYNHLQGRCQHPVRCGVCSQAHASEQCIRRHKARQLMTARCPNCFGGHHAWNPRCPERLRQLPGGVRRLQGGPMIGRGSKIPLFLLRFLRGRHGGVRVHLTPTSRGRGD
ncbi:hypothetical protein GWK47_018021 [Chionoecetes opilio]|uniref:Nucleic-acid-binding protein from transposon X-element n=1 Tax=Chionoecetes opilio TaxID=41210 RepID=A0A8J4XVJ5_CHIOP|nr:hypothetical protein GWK47_018021 [Chionoecetes opilio]